MSGDRVVRLRIRILRVDMHKVIGLMVVRNEAAIVQDTLDDMAEFCDCVVVQDDASEDETRAICAAHPVVADVLVKYVWEPDRTIAQARDRDRVLKAARKYGGADDWFVYMDADERIDFDWLVLEGLSAGAVKMRVFDFYITAADVGLRYDARRWLGPEYRKIVMAFQGRWGAGYGGPCQREVTLRPGCGILHAGSVKHYGKAISVEEWERTCDYYSRFVPKYAAKWEARKGKAVHERSDFGRELIRWEERGAKGVLL